MERDAQSEGIGIAHSWHDDGDAFNHHRHMSITNTLTRRDMSLLLLLLLLLLAWKRNLKMRIIHGGRTYRVRYCLLLILLLLPADRSRVAAVPYHQPPHEWNEWKNERKKNHSDRWRQQQQFLLLSLNYYFPFEFVQGWNVTSSRNDRLSSSSSSSSFSEIVSRNNNSM